MIDKKSLKEERAFDNILESNGSCLMCGFNQYPDLIQFHHIAGRNNNDLTIPLCLNCHGILSKKQYSWDDHWTKKDNSSRIRFGFILRGISDILFLIARILRNYSDMILKGEI